MPILLYLFIGIVAIQLFYYLFVFSKFAFIKVSKTNQPLPSVSLIICIKNEAELLEKNLIAFLQQKYPTFEIVLVDDASADHSVDVMENFAAQHHNIKIVKVDNVEAFWGNRKFALTLGIKAAKYEHLLFTSIQCQPISSNWMATMSAQFSKEKTIVLGHANFEKVKNSPINALYRFEKVMHSTSTFGWTKFGWPYQGDGKNLAYHRSEFFKTRGFTDHMKIHLGEDILFINQAADAKNTTFAFENESNVLMPSPKKFSTWFNEKRRIQGAYLHIKPRDQWQLKIFHYSQVLFFVLSIVMIFVYPDWEYVLGLILLRYLATWIVIGFSSEKLSEKELIVWYPLLEIGLIFTRLNMIFTNFFSKPIS